MISIYLSHRPSCTPRAVLYCDRALEWMQRAMTLYNAVLGEARSRKMAILIACEYKVTTLERKENDGQITRHWAVQSPCGRWTAESGVKKRICSCRRVNKGTGKIEEGGDHVCVGAWDIYILGNLNRFNAKRDQTMWEDRKAEEPGKGLYITVLTRFAITPLLQDIVALVWRGGLIDIYPA